MDDLATVNEEFTHPLHNWIGWASTKESHMNDRYVGMHYSVVLRDRQTGECRQTSIGTWTSDCKFWWTDGNFGCDCNRHYVFASGSPVDEAPPCNHNNQRYTVEYVEFSNGDRVPLNSPPSSSPPILTRETRGFIHRNWPIWAAPVLGALIGYVVALALKGAMR